MYSRDFGSIRSEGQLYNMEREYNEARNNAERGESEAEAAYSEKQSCEPKAKRGLRFDFLRDIAIDDLILIGIGILLLLDSDGENDIFVILIALLPFF